MLLNLELNFIKSIQSIYFTDNYTIIDNLAKLISSRKYKKYFIALYLFFIFFNSKNINEYINVPKIYVFAYLSRIINIKIKLIFKRKRPYVIDSEIRVQEKTREKKKDTFSFPSNSIQTSLIFYGFILRKLDLNIYYNTIILGIIVFITSFAKINRGLHYPSDILFSILIYYITIKFYNYLLVYLFSNLLK